VYDERWAERPLGPLVVYLHGLQDPGNVGTIIRSAEAFGVNTVALGPGTADPFSLKAVRASMGAVFAVPLVKTADVGELPGVKVALTPGAGAPLDELWRSTCGYVKSSAIVRSGAEAGAAAAAGAAPDVSLLVGAEREGLPEPVLRQADVQAQIPIRTHSLNAAMAATVALYELTRMAREMTGSDSSEMPDAQGGQG
jgi:RNA methyltransferase, TrmH family